MKVLQQENREGKNPIFAGKPTNGRQNKRVYLDGPHQPEVAG